MKAQSTSSQSGAAKTQYISTAIVYPNARIHVGFAWECMGADWLARSFKALGHETWFSTGMDEHSLNVQKAAESKGLTPKSYCDEMATEITRVLKEVGISFDRFIRTSDADHARVVTKLIARSFENGDIYPAKYEGHYCEGCEAYYTEKDLKDGHCPTHQTKPRWISEENYFFKLSKYQQALLAHFEAHPEFLQPESSRSEVLSFIKQGLKDFSISRSTFTWGIPLPQDPKQVIYVWFDALINYLTAAGIEHELNNPISPQAADYRKRWPAAYHIIGKDIARFHTIYWPAMLMSMELPLPERVFAHGWLNLKGQRMSKSSGNFVTPDEVVQFCGPDPLRYYLLAENQFANDGNFAWESLVLKNNSDLSNDWGNLVNRSISMARKYFPDQRLEPVVQTALSAEVVKSFASLLPELEQAVRAVDTAGYAQSCRERSRVLNLFIDQAKPWKLAKDAAPESQAQLREVIYTLLEGIRFVATGFLPILPFRMPLVFEQLGITEPKLQGLFSTLEWGKTSFLPQAPSPIYPRLELKE